MKDNKHNSSFFFPGGVVYPLTLIEKTLRYKEDYEKDFNAEKTALKFIEKLTHCYEGNKYLITVSQDVCPPSKLRTRKGILWKDKELKKFEISNLEVHIDKKNTRLLSLVSLDSFDFKTSETYVLNWIYSFILLSQDDISNLACLAQSWLLRDHKSILPFDFNAISKSLIDLDKTILLRYFPAENTRDEMLIIVGNSEYINTEIRKCISLL